MIKKEFIERYGEEAYQRRLEYRKQHYQQHKEETKEQHKQYYQQHKEQHKQYLKKYYQQHKEQHKQYMKQYKQQHREEIKQYYRKYNNMFAYCIPEQIEQIENYQFAKKDNFDGWCIHHRLETHNSDGEKRLVNLSREELIALDMYYNRPASELVFLTKSEHMKLHRNNKANIEQPE